MSFLKKLFGMGGDSQSQAVEVVDHNGFQILVAPINEGGQYRVCADITKDIDGEIKTHRLIRADVCNSRDEACDISMRKAKQVIDEQGERIFS